MIHIYLARAAGALLCTAALAPPIAHRLTHPDLAHYAPIASQDERAAGKFGYTPFPDFPHVELVQDGTGEPNRDLTGLITDPQLQKMANDKVFKVLHVRNFTPNYAAAVSLKGDLIIPFILSLKQYRATWREGTLNLKGTLTLKADGSAPIADITQYDDSQIAERVGRMYWLHEVDDLNFAKAIAESQLSHWLAKDPSRLERLRAQASVNAGPKS